MAQVLPTFYESFARGQRDALDFQNTIEEEKRRKAAELRTQEMFPLELEGKRGYNDLQTQYIRRQRQQGDYTEAVQPYQIRRDISDAEAQILGFKNRAEFERAVAASAAGASAEAPPEMRSAVMRDSLIPSVERGTWAGNYFRPTAAPNISDNMSADTEYSGFPPYARQPQQNNIPAIAPGYVDPTLQFPFDSAKALELYDPNKTSANKSLSSSSTYTSARASAPNPFGEPITFPPAPQIDPSVPTFYNAPPAETPRRPTTFTERYMPETAAIRERTAKPREGASIAEELGRKAANAYGYLRAPSEILENALPQMVEGAGRTAGLMASQVATGVRDAAESIYGGVRDFATEFGRGVSGTGEAQASVPAQQVNTGSIPALYNPQLMGEPYAPPPERNFNYPELSRLSGLTPEQVQYVFETDRLVNASLGLGMATLFGESGFNPNAVSSKDARGIAQITGATAALLNKKYGTNLNPMIPAEAIQLHRLKMLDIQGNVDPNNPRDEELMRLYFAGPDRRKWGKETEAYPGYIKDRYQQLHKFALGAQ